MYPNLHCLFQKPKFSVWMVMGMACFVLYSFLYRPYFGTPTETTNSFYFMRPEETRHIYSDNEKLKVTLQTAPPLPSYLSVCTVIKNEQDHIDEWIYFHILAGVERFIFYDDNSTDRSVDILQDYIKTGWVILETAKVLYDQKIGKSMTKLNSHKHCLEKYGLHTRWMTFLDIDEFLFSPRTQKLPTILSDFETFPAVLVRSVIFGSSGHLTKPNGLVIENYLHRAPLMKSGVKDVPFNIKSIVDPGRTKICPFDYSSICFFPFCFEGVNNNKSVETPTEEFTLYPVNESMKKIITPSIKGFTTIDRLRVNIYRTKSYEEYIMSKTKTGDVEECDATVKLGKLWKEVDLNDEKDTIILNLLSDLRDSMELPNLKKTPTTPLESSMPHTNNIIAPSSGDSKAVYPSQRFTVLVLSTAGSAGKYLSHILNSMNSNTIQKPTVLHHLLKELTMQQVSDPNQLSLGFDISLLSVFQRSFFAELGTAILRKIHFSTKDELNHLLPQDFPVVEKPSPLPLFGYLYDTRLPVFAPLWRELIGDKRTVCVILNSDPRTLSAHYKKGYPNSDPQTSSSVNDLLTSWEKYTTASLKACQGLPTIIVRESELLKDPYKAILQLHYNLMNSMSDGNDERLGLKILTEDELKAETNNWCEENEALNTPFCHYVEGEYNVYEKLKSVPFGSVNEQTEKLFQDIEAGDVFKREFGNYLEMTFAQNEMKL